MDAEGVKIFDHYISLYKNVRDDVTAATLQMTGNQGESHEIYEKINPAIGKGIIVLFANHKGEYFYVSKAKVDAKVIVDKGVTVLLDADGYVVIKATCEKSEAKIIFFGAK